MFTESDRQLLRHNQVRLVAVTKYHSPADCLTMIDRFEPDAIAESHWQEAQSKLDQLSSDMEKHFIGHIQTNKAKYIVQHFDVIQSVDSVRLASVLNDAANRLQKLQSVFLQVNISQDTHKHGFLVDDISTALDTVRSTCPHLIVKGLMTITMRQTIQATRLDFRRMKQLQMQLQLPELSMGMSDDWRLAVEEGATMVRIGHGLFE